MHRRRLDRTDLEIINALQDQARLSNKELAARIGLAPSSCLERVRKLNAQGMFTGFHASVAPDALGIGLQAMVMVRLERHSREVVEAFRQHLIALEEVVSFYHVAGRHDFIVHVAVPNADYLRDFALDAFTNRPEVAHMETSLIFENRRPPVWPSYVKYED